MELPDARPGIMQVVDALDAGGLERVAVNLANLLPPDAYRSVLCTTRRDGALASDISASVGRLRLGRRGIFDARALRKMVAFIRSENIRLLHPHGSALFMAAAASLFPPHPA